ncbi:hypothetical protein HZA75_01105 [Candidatus Roizmanbacteria bacterium]|nr:hypothetical protein [Candidatus Roizmanbacteria bacterium]
MKIPTNKLVFYLIIIFSFILLFLIMLFNLLSKKPTTTPLISPTFLPTPTSIPPPVTRIPVVSVIPPSTNNLPTYAPEKGRGVDLEAPLIKNSTREIQKLYRFLPLNQEVRLSTGLTVSIVIPAKDLQSNPWTLTVQIFGIDYEIPQSDSSYPLMKNSFQEATRVVFNWIKNNNANPQSIIISWGDKQFIQDRAEEWVN